jgi:RNA polymerase sigma factor (sigma-70 family)
MTKFEVRELCANLRPPKAFSMGSAAQIDIRPRAGLRPSRRLLRLAGDDRLVQQIQRGSEAAFEVAFERHAPAILGFCRHMLGSPEEAEDAVQHTFAAAYGDLQRDREREIVLKPWLFAIARNRCLSVLRARREHATEEPELVTEGLADEVERRAELRQLLVDLHDLPDEQREALLLAEVGGLAHADIAGVLDCEVARVKGLVFRARSALVARREARALPCQEVREQLANLRGGSLRRNDLRLHLRECPGCRDFREQVRRQRALMSIALPVAPTLGLKANVLAAVGVGGGTAGAAAGGAAVAGGGAAGGAVGAGALGGAAKVAAVAALAIGGVGGGAAVVVSDHHSEPSKPAPAVGDPVQRAAPAAAPSATSEQGGAQTVEHSSTSSSVHQRGHKGSGRGDEVSAERSHGQRGEAERESHAGGQQGRGPIQAPPEHTPVKRGPPEDKVKPEHDNEAQAPKVEDEQGPSADRQNGAQSEDGGQGQKGEHPHEDTEG